MTSDKDKLFAAGDAAGTAHVDYPVLAAFVRKGFLVPSMVIGKNKGATRLFSAQDVLVAQMLGELQPRKVRSPQLKKLAAFMQAKDAVTPEGDETIVIMKSDGTFRKFVAPEIAAWMGDKLAGYIVNLAEFRTMRSPVQATRDLLVPKRRRAAQPGSPNAAKPKAAQRRAKETTRAR
jgi:hypothetical protein